MQSAGLPCGLRHIMFPTVEKGLLLTLLIPVFLGAIAEMIAIWRWWPTYWRTGLPLFKRTWSYHSNQTLASMTDRLQDSFPTYLSMRVKWRQLSDTEIGFREWARLFSSGFHYTPIMRGLIRINPVTQFVEVIGILNWSVMLVLVFFICTAFVVPSPIGLEIVIASIAVGILVGTYFVQRALYVRITSKVRDLLGSWE